MKKSINKKLKVKKTRKIKRRRGEAGAEIKIASEQINQIETNGQNKLNTEVNKAVNNASKTVAEIPVTEGMSEVAKMPVTEGLSEVAEMPVTEGMPEVAKMPVSLSPVAAKMPIMGGYRKSKKRKSNRKKRN